MGDQELRAAGLEPGTFGWYATKDVACPRCKAAPGTRCTGEDIGAPLPHGWVMHTHDERLAAHNETKAASREAAKVNHPAHYGGEDNPYEAIRVMEAWHGKDAVRIFCICTAEKYLSRAGKKDGEPIERDLKKARWYIDYAIKMLGEN